MKNGSDHLLDLIKLWETPVNMEDLPSLDYYKAGARTFDALLPSDCAELVSFAPRTPKIIDIEVIKARRVRLGAKTKPAQGLKRRPQVDPRAGAGRQGGGGEGGGGNPQGLGCSRCRWSVKGCAKCKAKRGREAPEAEAEAVAVQAAAPGVK